MGPQTAGSLGLFAARVKTALIHAVFPNRCLVCGDVSPQKPRGSEGTPGGESGLDSRNGESRGLDIWHRLDPYVCLSCSTSFLPVISPICKQCGLVFGSRDGEDHLCGQCLERPRRYGKARAFCIYERTGLELIHGLKYRGKIQLAKPLGALLYTAFSRHWAEGDIDTLIPVPLHPSRFRERGFNQAYLLVRNWPGLRQVTAGPVGDDRTPIQLDWQSLVRVGKTDSQTGSGRGERMANVKNVFAIREGCSVIGKRILLIDDVYTTGATAEACAGVLLGHGAAHVDVLTLARAM